MKALAIIFGLFLSSQATAQWTQLPGPYGGGVYGFYHEDSTIYAGTETTLYQSNDLGRTWSDMNITLPQNTLHCNVLYKRGDLLLLNVWLGTNQSMVLRSEDLGKTFTTVTTPMSFAGFATIADTFYLCGSSIIPQIVFRSTDLGKQWQDVTPPGLNVLSIAGDGKHLYMITATSAIDYQLQRSSDGGNKWDTLRGLPESIQPSVTYPPAILHPLINGSDTMLWVGFNSDGASKLYRSTLYYLPSFGDSLHDALFPLHNDSAYTGREVPKYIRSMHGKVYVGTQDSLYRYDIASAQWTNMSLNLSSFCSKMGGAPNDIYPIMNSSDVLIALPNVRGIIRFNATANRYEASDTGLSRPYITYLTNINDTLYAHAYTQNQYLYLSTTHGQTWTATGYKESHWTNVGPLMETSNGLLVGGNDTIQILRNLVPVARARIHGIVSQFVRNGNLLIARSSGGVYTSKDEGGTWGMVGPEPEGTNTFASFNGRLLAGARGLMQSDANANIWNTMLPFPFSSTNFKTLAVDGSLLFAGVHFLDKRISFGVFKSSDEGQSWQLISSYQPEEVVPTSMLALDGFVLCGTNEGLFICGYNGQYRGYMLTGLGSVTSVMRDSEFVYAGFTRSGIWRARIADLMEYAGVEPQPTASEAPLIFPNPVRTMAALHADDYSHITITDLLGRTVYRSERREQYDLSHLQTGIYSVALYKGDRSLVVQKFVKQ